MSEHESTGNKNTERSTMQKLDIGVAITFTLSTVFAMVYASYPPLFVYGTLIFGIISTLFLLMHDPNTMEESTTAKKFGSVIRVASLSACVLVIVFLLGLVTFMILGMQAGENVREANIGYYLLVCVAMGTFWGYITGFVLGTAVAVVKSNA